MTQEPIVFYKEEELSGGGLRLSLEHTFPGFAPLGYVPSYDFAICDARTGERMGRIALRLGSSRPILYLGHIGYSVEPPYRGHHYAAKACRLLVPLARKHGMRTLLITCNPDNLPSRRTCELLGAKLRRIVDLPPDTEMYQKGERQKCVYEWMPEA